MKQFLLIFIVSCASLSGAIATAWSSEPPEPNIILVLVDDLGYGDPHCYNPDSKIPTPNIDRLAAEGMRFTDAHSPSAVCSPTRYGILTGRFAWRTRLKAWVLDPWDRPLIEPDRLTVAEMLRQHGYRTACIGKWHLGFDWPTKDGKPPIRKPRDVGDCNVDFSKPIGGGPIARGFDEYFGVDAANYPPHAFIEGDRLPTPPTAWMPRVQSMRPGPMQPGWKQEGMMPAITERTIQFLDRQAKESPRKPFFVYMALTAPHTPLVPNKEFIGRSQAGIYGDFVAEVDDSLGKVAAALKDRKSVV